MKFNMELNLTPHALYAVIFALFFATNVHCVTVNNGVADFSDEPANQTDIVANFKFIKTVNASTLKHLTQVKEFDLWANKLMEFPDFSPMGNTLQKLRISYNYDLNMAANHKLAMLRQLRFLDIRHTGLSLITTTCPETSSQEFFFYASDTPLYVCDCRMVWLKVSNEQQEHSERL